MTQERAIEVKKTKNKILEQPVGIKAATDVR